MKKLIIIGILLLSCNCWAEQKEERGFDATPPPLSTDDIPMSVYKSQADIIVINHRVKKIEDTLDKIYSMVADLEVKFMGQERYNQIYDPENIGEVAKQKLYEKQVMKELIK